VRRLARTTALLSALILAGAVAAHAQTLHGTVVDQTGLPLPGVTIQLRDGDRIVASTLTSQDGSFELIGTAPRAQIVAALEGFERVTVAPADTMHIVLPLARATETTTVVAPFVEPSPTTANLGAHLTADTLARLPSSRLKAKESLPLLPSVVRGADGLLRVGGARPYETPLLVDGFNVTDPATGTSNINLPFEAVRGVEVLRDPMAVSYGGLVGGLMQIDSKPGGDQFKMGVQGFVPRPRFSTPGFGRLEGIFPRVYAGGATAEGHIRYFATVEYDFERIPVPEVTEGAGPDIVEKSATIFGRVDVEMNDRHSITLEGLALPATTRSAGLSPRREELATADNQSNDLFAGITDRRVFGKASVLTIKVGVVGHNTTVSPNGSGVARLSPAGWQGNWFATIDRRAIRYSAAASWDHTTATRTGMHAVTIGSSITPRRLSGSVLENTLAVENAAGETVRTIDFAGASSIAARDARIGAWLRDVWHAHERLEIDAGARVDANTKVGGTAPSARAGVRYALDRAGLTVLKAGVGRFVGMIPLAVQAFGGYPARVDRSIDPQTRETVREIHLRPVVGRLRLPHAVAASIQVERQLTPSLDAQIGVTSRHSAELATLHVPVDGGEMPVQSIGGSRYRELQLSMRRTWKNDQQLFVSYVRSYALGELNDFAALFQTLDAPLLRPGGMARTPTDARNRWITWGTFNLPRRVVVSPVVEIRSGFPFSAFDERYGYFERPNDRDFPRFMAIDVVAYKTFTVRKRSADLGIQLFNATNHFNPRDVYPVAGAPQYGRFANSVGPILRGFMLLKW
jgi:hypothetical protein